MRYRRPQLPTELQEVTIDKLVHGGQGIGTLASGQKIFVWNALPGEQVRARIIKKKKNYLEAIAEEINTPSVDRLLPLDHNYLATSPWQIIPLALENQYKQEIVIELFQHEKISIPQPSVISAAEWHYRNKMEYSFWGDETGLHLALHERGSHGKQVVEGSSLALPAVDAAAQAVLKELQTVADLRAGDIKTVIVRAQQDGQVVAALFVKHENFPELTLPAGLKGMRVYFSNPKSPASVPTTLLYELGETTMRDDLLGRELQYDVAGFFQVNIPVFEQVLSRIKEIVGDNPSIDMYSGVGSIGIPVGSDVLIELDPANAEMARRNAAQSKVIEASSETALTHITGNHCIIVDPPRAGLHKAVVERLLEVQPPLICYLSCNPATQARDIALLQKQYAVDMCEIYNFFPHTPHIEVLTVLRNKI